MIILCNTFSVYYTNIIKFIKDELLETNLIIMENIEPSIQDINKQKPQKKKKTVLREWLDAIVFAVIVATVVRWALMSAYTIPTPSMEGTQMVGDFLFVSKVAYGARTPRTILRIPLTDNKVWGTEIPAYLSWLQLPTFRLPGYASISKNDIVVFNYPVEDAPIDMKTHYIKRCTGTSGDKIQVKQSQLFVNDKEQKNPAKIQHEYELRATSHINERHFEPFNLNMNEMKSIALGKDVVYYNHMTQETADNMLKTGLFKSIKINAELKDSTSLDVLGKGFFKWNKDNFGPVIVPKKGMTIDITPESIAQYSYAITHLDWNKKVEIKGNELYIDGKKQDKYTFKQNYFFMMGDNRHNSADSRFWGFVPEDHVVGRASFTWMSLDYNKSWFGGKIRWDRIFRGIY